jgi:hypothetical protein
MLRRVRLRHWVLVGAAALTLFMPALAQAAPASRPNNAPVTLRCMLNGGGSPEPIVQYYTLDAGRRTVTLAGDVYSIGPDPSGHTGRAIVGWSDTEITLINEEWIRNGWQRFRVITVLDRLTGEIRSEVINSYYSGICAVADVAKQVF